MGHVMDMEISLSHFVSFFICLSFSLSLSLSHTRNPLVGGGGGAFLGFTPPHNTGTPERPTLPREEVLLSPTPSLILRLWLSLCLCVRAMTTSSMDMALEAPTSLQKEVSLSLSKCMFVVVLAKTLLCFLLGSWEAPFCRFFSVVDPLLPLNGMMARQCS